MLYFLLYRLVQDREMQLFDGTKLLRADRYDALLNEYGTESMQGTFRIQ